MSVTIIAKTLLDRHKSIEGAAEALIQAALQDPALQNELTANALRNAAYMAVRSAAASQRNNGWKIAATVPLSASAKEWADAIGHGLLSTYRVTSGNLLQDATLEEVMETVLLLEQRSQDMMEKAAWLRLVASAIKPGMTVGKSITEKQARAMHARIIKTQPKVKSA